MKEIFDLFDMQDKAIMAATFLHQGRELKIMTGSKKSTDTDQKKRVWNPKCRSEKFEDKRTKRNRTRSDRNKKSIKDSKEE